MIAYLLAAIFEFCLAAFVLWNGRSATAIAFSILVACAGLWSVELLLLNTIPDASVLSPWFHVTRLGLFFIAPMLIVFHALITRTPMTGGVRLLVAVSFAVSLALAFTNLVFLPTRLVKVPSGYAPAVDSIYILYGLNFAMACVTTVTITFRAYRQAIFREKTRLKWLAAGIAIGCVLGMLSFKYPKGYVGTVGSVISLCCIAYAVVRHRLISVKAAIGNGTIRMLSLAILGGGYLALDLLIDRLGGEQSQVFLLVLAFVAALELYPRLNQALKGWRDRYYFQSAYNYDHAKARLQTMLKATPTQEGFIRVCDELFTRTVRVERYSFHMVPKLFGLEGTGLRQFDPRVDRAGVPAAPSPLQDAAFLEMLFGIEETIFYDEVSPAFKDQFAHLGASALVPVRSGAETVGFILLGAPCKEEQFSYDDIRLLNWFGAEVGPVLENLLALIRLESSLDEAEKTLSVVSRLNEYNHDIKTPFSNIEALLLAGDAFSAEERQSKILDQVRKGHALVSTMTGLLRGRHSRRSGAFDLNDVIRRVVASFPTKAGLVETDLGSLPCLEGYEEEMELLFSNLLTNAFAAQDKPGHHVRVWTWSDAALGRVGCSVQDNGRGIPEHRLSGLWHGLETTRRPEGGTGVGLGVVKRIVEAHGGTIVVSSEEGVGTEFTFSLPVPDKVVQMPGARARTAVNG